MSFLKDYIGRGIGGGISETKALAPKESINVLGALRGAFKTPDLMD